ncbi:permease [Anaeroselena agilis]|uniref:Permease n=1 Tax=Anaeroselena agilis TaxID=3063788 RepID=A0ABU3NU04_9FIRM|nr:permease [Selenomonadales bacterium 4137-cl]
MLSKENTLLNPKSLRILVYGLVWYFLYIQLDPFANWFTYELLGFANDSHLGGAIAFFIADAPKVLILLVVITFIVGVARTFLSPERIRALLSGRGELAGNILAALVGIPTPFCSCSAIPLFLGFLQSGIPIGVSMAFLISCPVVNEVALALLFGLYGWKVAGLYALLGTAKAVIGGMVIARLRPERFLEPWVAELLANNTGPALDEGDGKYLPLTWEDRIADGNKAVRDILAGVWHYLVGGIALGAVIYGYMPVDFVSEYMGKEAWWNVPVAVLLGVPLYASAVGVIPIIQAFIIKGAALGTTLAFMMSVIGISIPELVMLRKVIKLQLIWIFVGIVALGCVVIGYVFNALI